MAKPARLRALARVEGTGVSCFVSFHANGTVAAVARCRDAIAVLRRAVSWHWQGDDIVLLDGRGRLIGLFKKQRDGHWRAEPNSERPIDLYPLVPEAVPYT